MGEVEGGGGEGGKVSSSGCVVVGEWGVIDVCWWCVVVCGV